MSKKVLWLMNLKKGVNSPGVVWWYGILEKFGYEVVYEPYEEYNIEDLYKKVKEYKPDYVIHPVYDKLHPELVRLREFSKLIILMSDDRWRYANFGKFWIPFADYIITYEGEESNYVSDGLLPEQFCKIRWCFNPNTMTLDNKFEKSILVSHTGGLHGGREQKLQQLKAQQFDSKLPVTVVTNKQIVYSQAKEYWASSLFSICFTQNSLNTGKELKGRVVECPNFCVLVTESFPDMERYYDVDNDIVIFETIEEARDKINYLLNNESEYNRIYLNGKQRLWNNNTAYTEWNEHILPKIDPDFVPVDVHSKLLEHKEFQSLVNLK